MTDESCEQPMMTRKKAGGFLLRGPDSALQCSRNMWGIYLYVCVCDFEKYAWISVERGLFKERARGGGREDAVAAAAAAMSATVSAAAGGGGGGGAAASRLAAPIATEQETRRMSTKANEGDGVAIEEARSFGKKKGRREEERKGPGQAPLAMRACMCASLSLSLLVD